MEINRFPFRKTPINYDLRLNSQRMVQLLFETAIRLSLVQEDSNYLAIVNSVRIFYEKHNIQFDNTNSPAKTYHQIENNPKAMKDLQQLILRHVILPA